MLGKKSNPVIEILTGSFVSSHISGILEFATSPRSHLESKAQSPKGLKSFDIGGVGLGIVAALENSGGGQNEIPANKALFDRNLSRSNPISITSEKERVSEEIIVKESLEEYTIVTCHGPNESYTKVYSGGGRKCDDRNPFRIQKGENYNRSSVFHISPVRSRDVPVIPSSDFLNSCDLCHKKLHGKDIYMYRGEKGFCSPECRYKQIVIDERIEKCSSEASRPVDVSGSPYSNEKILTTGILAS